ncbi:hypothetical protein BGW38_008252 [Lunasporangiospora selenospora]|uniref:Uncharacterized protein n=1 Tax=Lunasporangiospora selenospora TaxID=979761 RepID=A0A9P6FKG5_9FUNG|nr:hypothetical protein BGW38_008252 [Lunasporangiospora selenospora]
MDGVDCDWCLVCEKHTSNGAAYCSAECRSTDLISSSASSTSSSGSSTSSYSMTDANGSPLVAGGPGFDESYVLPPFVRKQRASIPNIYAHCTSNPNPPPSSLMFPAGHGPSALSQHLKQQPAANSPEPQPPMVPGAAATQFPLFYATLNALRPASPAPGQSSDRSRS